MGNYFKNNCTGKIYYELLNKQQMDERKDVAIVRLEQLYPLPEKQLEELFETYKGASFHWVQEEPKNMGAYDFVRDYFEDALTQAGCKQTRLVYAGRDRSPSTATGYAKDHLEEQKAIIKSATTTPLKQIKPVLHWHLY